jgi:hypothetical protein
VPLREESMIRIVVKFVVGAIGIESFRGAVELVNYAQKWSRF